MKHCTQCHKDFEPHNSMQSLCGKYRCAVSFAKSLGTERKAKTKARRAALKRIPDLIREAQTAFNAFIRERDKDQPCICCGKTASDGDLLTGSRWDAGHYRSTGSAPHLRFHEDNCHRQLVRCNRHGAGRAVDYRLGLIARIGLEAVEGLESNNAVQKWERGQLIEIRALYVRRLKEMKAKTEEMA